MAAGHAEYILIRCGGVVGSKTSRGSELAVCLEISKGATNGAGRDAAEYRQRGNAGRTSADFVVDVAQCKQHKLVGGLKVRAPSRADCPVGHDPFLGTSRAVDGDSGCASAGKAERKPIIRPVCFLGAT